ncbi:MAG TPA: PIN domain-containing protein [Dongiaceae bacterium]|nr:PIN domain-containing protein [Dongiaceae bacterium]
MKVFLDTNVLVAACVADHEHHSRALPVVQAVHDGEAEGFVSGHSLLEMHAILTRWPRVPRITAIEASALIAENIAEHFSVVALSGKEYRELAVKLGQNGVIGGKCYDALHLACAGKSGADRIYTFNVQHFTELAGPLGNRITAP